MTPAKGRDATDGPVDTVLFDAGGVLLDLDYAFLVRRVADQGVEVDIESLSRLEALARTEIERRVRAGGRTSSAWRDYFKFMLGEVGVPGDRHDPIVDELWDAHAAHGLWTVAIPGSIDVVRAVSRAGYRIGVVSNAEGRVEADLRAAGYDGLLETVVDSHVVGVEKPDPRIFAIALERLGARPERSVFVGDVPSVDVAGARAAGIRPVLLDRHGLYEDVDATRIGRLDELRAVLDAA